MTMSATQDTGSVSFDLRTEGSVGILSKSDETDDFVIWGPASVEIVDKENDRIQADALKDALPQLMKRASLSYEHSDQIVGEILPAFKTDESVEVEIGDEVVKREEFPTAVLKDELEEPALFVAGKVYGDTKKAREVREAIEKGDIDSFSISGEAIDTSLSIEDGQQVDNIEKIDLSAVTLCQEGMNQKSKFGVVKKRYPTEGSGGVIDPESAEEILKQTMSNNEDDDPLTKGGMRDILDNALPDGELATKEDVEEQVEKKLAEKENATHTGSPTEGTADRPDGEGGAGTEQDPEYEGDMDDEAVSDSDKVEEKSGFTMEELKSALPDDQFKAIQPVLEEKMEGMDDPLAEGGDDEEPPMPDEPEEPMEEVEPEDPEADDGMGDDDEEEVEVLGEEKAKTVGIDPALLTEGQKRKMAKADLSELQEVSGASGPSASDSAGSALDGADENSMEKALEKADDNTLAGSNFFDSDGGVSL